MSKVEQRLSGTPDQQGVFVRQSGAMVERVRAFDWSTTPLGPSSNWTASLKTAVGICLNSRFPMFIWWGPDLINIFNDAYVPILGRRVSAALGSPARALWSEIWDVVGPQVDAVMMRGEATWNDRVRLTVERNGFSEETWFTWSYSPIPDEQGKIAGLFCVCTEETSRVLAERERDRQSEQRRRSDERARLILESVTDAFFALDADWRFTYINSQGERILNRAPGELIGKVIWDEYADAIGTAFEQAYRGAMAEQVVKSFTSFYPAHDKWYEVRAYPTADVLSVYFRDVTEQKRIDDESRRDRDRLELIAQGANVGIWYCPLPFDRLYWDKTTKDHFHLAPDAEVSIDIFYQCIHPEDRERTRDAIDNSIREKRTYDTIYRTVSSDGQRTKWIRAIGRGFYDELGNPSRFDGMTIDNTDQRRAAEALATSERRFREMADTAPAMLWITEADGNCTFLSRGWYEFTGQAEADGLGLGWTNAVHPDDRENACNAFVSASQNRSEYNIDFRLRRADGVYRWVIDSGRPRFDTGGEFLGFIGAVIDIDDRKRVEEERQILLERERDARAEAERAGRMKDEFLATLSHELRTPLNAILGWATILTGSKPDDADLREGLETIQRNARAQTQIIEDLLDMSRIVSGKIRLDVQPTDLAAVVSSAVDTIRPAAGAKGVYVRVFMGPHAARISGDPGRLNQVFWNLLSNAVKFTPRGGLVNVALHRVESHCEVAITDTGEGIRAEFLPHVFDRFRQADASTTRRHGGLGLGLAIVKQLVELHGGSVRVTSAGPGTGSTFTVNLPLAALIAATPDVHPELDTTDAGRSGHSGQTTLLNLKGLNVLVVDDEADARSLAKRLLEDAEAVVRVAASVEEALAAFEQSPPDVLVSDIGMPFQDGYALIRRIRALPLERGGETPAIALTAYARTEDRVRVIRAGYQTHVVKPVDPTELITVIASLAARST